MNFTTGKDTIQIIKMKSMFMQKVLDSEGSIFWQQEHQVKQENAQQFLNELFVLKVLGKNLQLVDDKDKFYETIKNSNGNVEFGGRFCDLGWILSDNGEEIWMGYVAPVSAI